MAIYSCKGCVPPKRYPGCHGSCPEYAEEKAQYEKDTAAQKQKVAIQAGINSQKYCGVARAMRKKGRRLF
jgi:hypothetical protein